MAIERPQLINPWANQTVGSTTSALNCGRRLWSMRPLPRARRPARHPSKWRGGPPGPFRERDVTRGRAASARSCLVPHLSKQGG